MRIASILIIASLTMLGCVDDAGPAFFISGNLAPSDDCVFAPGNPQLFDGRYNVARHTGGYVLHPLFNNQLFPNSATAPPRPDPNALFVQGAEIEIRDAAGASIGFPGLPNPFSVTSSTYIPSSSGPGGTAGQAAGSLEIIPNAYASELDATLGSADASFRILVGIKPFGETTGHTSLDGLEYTWPIDICSGNCLFAVFDLDAEIPTCCHAGQDFTCSDGP